MLRFENQEFLYFLFIILLFVAGYIALYFIDRSRLRKYVSPELVQRLHPDRRKAMPHIKFGLCMLALVFLILAAAHPQTPGKEISARRSGVDILFCLDVSKSMDARDVSPNRLEACKMAINHCINQMSGNRVSAVIFAGSAEVALPATTDYESAKNAINLLTTQKIEMQGTNLSDALYRSAAALGVPMSEDEPELPTDTASIVQKAIILISDGEDHAEDAVAAARELKKHGILIFTIGIGTPTGTTIPDGKDVKRDAEGHTVITKLNEQILKDVAEAGGGSYTHTDNVHASFENIFQTIDQMAKSDFGKVKLTTYNSQFQYPLAIGIILLLVDCFLLTAKPRRKKSAVILLLAATCLLLPGCIKNKNKQQQNPKLAAANTKFAHADSLARNCSPYDLPARADSLYHQALRTYQQLGKSHPKFRNQSLFNLIDANYRIGNFDTIPHLVDSLLHLDISKNLAANTNYNLGNSHLANGKYLLEMASFQENDSLKNLAYQEFHQAIEAYKECLRKEPSDMDAKYNLLYAKKLLPPGSGAGGGGGQNGQSQQNGQQNQDGQKQQGNGNGQDQQQQRKEEQQQKGGGQGDKKEDQQKQDQQNQQGQNDQNKKDQQQGQNGQQQKQHINEDQKAMERQLNALKQNEKDVQKEHERMMVPVRPQKMEKDW